MNKMIDPVYIGNIPVGDGYPTVFMAEISTFFNQDDKLACEYIRKAVEAGAPVVKTEILHDPEVCLKDTGLLHEYTHGTGKAVEDYRALIERKTVSFEKYEKIFRYCQELKIPYVATAYDIEGIDFFAKVGGSALKIARNNINNIPLIRHAARTNLPVIFDAGGVYFDEIAYALRQALSVGTGGVIVNYHPAANPAPAAIHNMQIIKVYKEVFKVPVGLACHYKGDEILYLSVGMGANILEKGVDNKPERIEQDVISAAPLDDLPEIIQKVSNCWKALGQGLIVPKEPRDLSTRACMVAKCSIRKGEIFGTHNVRFSWPPIGISVAYWDLVDGKRAALDIEKGQPLKWIDVYLD